MANEAWVSVTERFLNILKTVTQLGTSCFAKGPCIPVNDILELLDLNTHKCVVIRHNSYVNENEQLIIVMGTRAHH
jgi:hypothetical protein